MHQLIVLAGLGNPGARYAATRHNIGFMVLDLFADRLHSTWISRASEYMEASLDIDGQRILLIKPLTYMNLCGEAFAVLERAEGIRPSQLLVVCDDFQLELGRLRLRRSGGDGGHNGLGSLIEYFGTELFHRLRVGTGPVPESMNPTDFVLENFEPEDNEKLENMLVQSSDCLETYLKEGIDRAMSRFNSRNQTDE